MSHEIRIEQKIDKISEKISSIDATLAAQHISLREHMRRTALLENEIRPIKKHVYMIQGIVKFVGLLAIVIGIIEAVRNIVK